MNEHRIVSDLLPLYVSGVLEEKQHDLVERHLHTCAECQADLALWQATAGEVAAIDRAVSAPPDPLNGALERIRLETRAKAPLARRSLWRWLVQLLRTQAPLVRREIWPASAAVMLLGVAAALVSHNTAAIRILAPLVAATCLSILYGPENDPVMELAMATPTSPRQILLARLVLVFGYNLVLALVASIGMLQLIPTALYGELVLGWLAPMTFLSAVALLLSLWIGSGNAITLTYAAWLAPFFLSSFSTVQHRLISVSPAVAGLLENYLRFWAAPGVLILLSIVLFGAAFWLVGRQEYRLPQAVME